VVKRVDSVVDSEVDSEVDSVDSVDSHRSCQGISCIDLSLKKNVVKRCIERSQSNKD
jgi:hypothetical protein